MRERPLHREQAATDVENVSGGAAHRHEWKLIHRTSCFIAIQVEREPAATGFATGSAPEPSLMFLVPVRNELHHLALQQVSFVHVLAVGHGQQLAD